MTWIINIIIITCDCLMQMMAKTANFKDQIIILFSFCTVPECQVLLDKIQFANGNMSGCIIKHF